MITTAPRQEMEKALQKTVMPLLRQKRFTGNFPHLRKITPSEIHLISFQFHKHGGGFVVEVAKTKNEPFRTRSGEIIDPKKLIALYVEERERICPKGYFDTKGKWHWYEHTSTLEKFWQKMAACFTTADYSWFRYDSWLSSDEIYDKVATRAAQAIKLRTEEFIL